MRVGIIAACPFPAHHGTPGGIREHAEALAELGHEVHVITYASHQAGTVRGATIHRIPAVGPVHKVVVGPTMAKMLWDFLLALKTISVVHMRRLDILHGVNYEGAMAGLIARWVTGRPLVYGAINTMSDELPTYKFIRPAILSRLLAQLLDRTVPHLADHVACCTPTIRDVLLRLGVPRERLSVVHLGIDLSMFAGAQPGDVRARMGVNHDPLVVYTGVLNKFQRIDYLLRAMRVVRAKLPAAKLAFVRTLDDDGQRREVERTARHEGVADALLFPGIIGLDDLPAYIAAADASAIPRPDCPGVPVKLLNFMAVGKPVVVTKGSSQGLRDGVEALVTPDHDPEAMGQALLRILTNKALANRLGQRARMVAYAEYDRRATTVELVKLYEHVLGGKDRAKTRSRPRPRQFSVPGAGVRPLRPTEGAVGAAGLRGEPRPQPAARSLT